MTIPDLALLLLRLTVGLTFAAHGAQKAFGWWGGPGPEGWSKAVGGMGYQPLGLFAGLAVGAELIGGLALALGLLTPLAAAALVAQALVIILRVHWPQGFFNQAGGLEFPLVLGVGAMAVGLIGAGGVSLDAWLGLEADPATRVLLVLAGLVAGALAFSMPELRETWEERRARDRLRRG
jgi:putative oxidoreductase